MATAQLQQGIQAAKAGDKATARKLLALVVHQEPDNEMAWIWLARVLDTPAQKLDCLRQALRINPQNNPVRQAIEALTTKATPPDVQEPAAPEPEPAPEPEEDWATTPVWATETEQAPPEQAEVFETEATLDADSDEGWAWDMDSPWATEAEKEPEPEAEAESFWQADEAEEEDIPAWDFDQAWSEESDTATESATASWATESPEDAATPEDVVEAEAEATWNLDALWDEQGAAEPEAASTWEPEAAADVAPSGDLDDIFGEFGLADEEDAAAEASPSVSPFTQASDDTGGGVFDLTGEDEGLSADLFGDEPDEPTAESVEIPEPEAKPPSRVSLLDRNRMDRIRAARPAPTVGEGAEGTVSPVPAFAGEAEGEAASLAAAAPATEAMAAKPPRARVGKSKRRLRLFGLFGLLDIPVIAILLVLLLSQNTAPTPSKKLAVACGALDRATFTVQAPISDVGSVLMTDILFSADTEYHIDETLVISPGRRVLIEAGATLVFAEGTALDVQGQLYVCGSEAAPVIFTAEEKEPGGWTGLRIYDATPDDVMMNYLELYFAGDRALYLERSAPTMANLTIANAALFPISLDGLMFPDLSVAITFRDTPFNAVEIRASSLPSGNVTWPNYDVVYVVTGLLKVGPDTTFDIAPDVVIKVWPGPSSRVSGLWVRGLFKAENVRFTSVYDDADDVGGPTYLEARDAKPGDWGGITFHQSSADCVLQDVVVRYAGEGQGAISLRESSPQLNNVTVTQAAWYPVSVDADSFPVLEGLTLAENSPGDALEVRGGSAMRGAKERTWDLLGTLEQPVVRVIQGVVTIAPEAKLTIGPGVVVKFAEQGQLVVEGTLYAVGGGTEDNRIVLTSLHDDKYGGDTDGQTSSRAVRQWQGLIYDGVDENSVMQNVLVRYATIQVNSGTPRLINNQFRDSEGPGVALMPNAQPRLLSNVLAANSINGVAILPGEITAEQTWVRLGDADDQIVRVLTGKVLVTEKGSLRIEAGTIVKSDMTGTLTISGTLEANGMAHMPIRLTSVHDDDFAGDTDRSVESAEPGDWQGVEIGLDADVKVSHFSILYAETGLTMHGGNVPVIGDGRLQIAKGNHALWCDGAAQIPGGFLIEENQVNETWCPTR